MSANEMPEAGAPAAASANEPIAGAEPVNSRRGPWIFLGACLLVAAAVLGYLVVVAGARIDAPTVALALGAIALLYALRQMFFVVQALSRPPVEHLLAELEAPSAEAELRRIRMRVLRAIKQLDEDHALGKLEAADHAALREDLVLQAVDLQRRIRGGAHATELHPALLRDLGVEATAAGEGAADTAASSHDAREAGCSACGLANDLDARFCKHCGAALELAGEGAEQAEAAP